MAVNPSRKPQAWLSTLAVTMQKMGTVRLLCCWVTGGTRNAIVATISPASPITPDAKRQDGNQASLTASMLAGLW